MGDACLTSGSRHGIVLGSGGPQEQIVDFDVTQSVQEINIVFANRTIAVEAILSILLVVVFMDLP